MKKYGEVPLMLHAFTSALDGGEWRASRFCRYMSGKRITGSHWIAGRLASSFGVDVAAEGGTPGP
jgi:hypothetical protein